MPHFQGKHHRGSRNSFQLNETVNKNLKKVHLGEEPLYRAKKPAKNHNPDQILPPNMYLAMAIVKGAGL